MATSTLSAIVSRGSNSNGEWIRFEDGTQICTKRENMGTVSHTNAWGSWYESTSLSLGNWAKEFAYQPTVSAITEGTAFWIEAIISPSKTSAGSCFLARPDSGSHSCIVDVIGIGRWK